jgi:hypothetical protein
MRKHRNIKSAMNITLGSVALFLIVLPEPATTLAGLALLGYINNSTRDQNENDNHPHFQDDASYGNMVYKRASLGLETTSQAKRGVLSSPQIVRAPAYGHSHDWKHTDKSTGITRSSDRLAAITERGLLARSRSVPYTPHNHSASSGNESNKPVQRKQTLPETRGELPRSWPNMPASYHDNHDIPAQIKQPVNKAFRNITGTTPTGQMPIPWPNMPDTRFTKKRYRATK